MTAEEIIGKTYIQFQDRKIEFPYKIHDVIIGNKILFVRINGYLPDDITKKLRTENQTRLSDEDLKIYNKHAHIVNQNIMCFDLDGNLKWKIPKAYTEEVDQEEVERVGHPYITSYVYMELESESVLMARTSYGNRIRVNIADGALLSRTEGTRF